MGYMDNYFAQLGRQGNILQYGDQRRRQNILDQENRTRNALAMQVQQAQLQQLQEQNAMQGRTRNALRGAVQPYGPFAEGMYTPENPRPIDLQSIGRSVIQGGGDPLVGMGYIEKGLSKKPDTVDYQLVQNANGEYVRVPKRPGMPVDPTGVMGETGKGQTSVNVDVSDKGMTKLAQKMSEDIVSRRQDVLGAVSALENMKEAKNLLNAGIITGTGAEFLVNMGNLLSSRLGVQFAEDPVANTQAYAATMGNQVGQIIKQFGAGTGLSDADREYAEKIVAGKITLTEPAIRRLLNINERAFKNVIKRYQRDAEQAMSRPGAETLPYDLRIDYSFDGDKGGSRVKPPAAMSDEELLKALGG